MPTEDIDQRQLEIEKLVYGGDGLARANGQVVLMPFVLPGETVKAQVRRAKNDLLRGELREVVRPSDARIEPACPYFARCGGCHYQHASTEFQAEQKQLILREVLRRVGRIDFSGEIGVVEGDAWQYRNRVQLHIHAGYVGYFAPGSHNVVRIDHCPVASPKLNDTIALLARDLPHYRWFDNTVELFTNETEVQVNVLDRIPGSVRALFESLGTGEPIEYGSFRVSRNSFFQVNRFMVEALVETSVAGFEGKTALDLYAGVGLFASRLARDFARVTAVESGGSAFRDLEWNMQRGGLAVDPVRKTAEEYLASLESGPELVLADPPRTGLGKVATRELLRLRPPNLVIVSCDPATLARDLSAFLAGGYQVERLTMVDLFPQTYHLESVVHLRT